MLQANLLQNPNPCTKSKIPHPKSKRPRLGLPQEQGALRESKIQSPQSKLQNPISQRWAGLGRRPERKDVWKPQPMHCGIFGRPQSSQPKGARLDSARARHKSRTDPEEDFAGHRAPISSPVSWKPGLNFRK